MVAAATTLGPEREGNKVVVVKKVVSAVNISEENWDGIAWVSVIVLAGGGGALDISTEASDGEGTGGGEPCEI